MKIIIARFFVLAQRVLTLLPSFRWKTKMRKRLKRWQDKIAPNLFDDKTFLSYVKRKKEGLSQNISTIETLAMRGSNSDYGFYPPDWNNSYNLGLTSTDLYTTYFLYKNNRYNLKKLRNIIVFFNIPSPGYSLIYTSERYRAVAYKYFFNIPYAKDGFIDTKYEDKILKKCKELSSIEISSGYNGYEKKTYYGKQITAENRVKPHLRENQRKPSQMHWLKELAKVIKEDNRKLFIIIPPFKSDYKKLLPEQTVLFNELFQLKGIQILNFFNSELFSDADFGDHDHFNEQGAKKMTNEIHSYFKSNNLL